MTTINHAQADACANYIRATDSAFMRLCAYPSKVMHDAMQYPSFVLLKMAEGVTPEEAAGDLYRRLSAVR